MLNKLLFWIALPFLWLLGFRPYRKSEIITFWKQLSDFNVVTDEKVELKGKAGDYYACRKNDDQLITHQRVISAKSFGKTYRILTGDEWHGTAYKKAVIWARPARTEFTMPTQENPNQPVQVGDMVAYNGCLRDKYPIPQSFFGMNYRRA